MAGTIHRKQDWQSLKCIPSSENVVGRCIDRISEGLKKQILNFAVWEFFAVWLDGSRAVCNVSAYGIY